MRKKLDNDVVQDEQPVYDEQATFQDDAEMYVNEMREISRPEEPVEQAPVKSEAAQYLGTKLTHDAKGRKIGEKERQDEMFRQKGLAQVGENILQKQEIRDGWIDVNRNLLGDRDIFYPETWQFRVRPATVEAIRNWSQVDDENPLVVNEVFNEILKSCLMITDGNRQIPWGNICAWDRFFFVMLTRDYTFVDGEVRIEYSEDCPECGNPINFVLTSNSLMYDLPDPEVMKYYDRETRTWVIDPVEFGVEADVIKLYVPTLEREGIVINWTVDKLRNKKKYDNVFVKFLPWLAPKLSKDDTLLGKQIREYELQYKHWDIPMFSLMDDILRNIAVTPSQKLILQCPICGEEVTSDIRFQNGISSLFTMANKHTKFGKK